VGISELPDLHKLTNL
jgi:hypothetical protein